MVFQVVLTRKAREDLEKLDRLVQKRVVAKLQFFAQNPLHHAEKLSDSSIGNFRFRVGSYRIIFDLDGNRIVVYRIGHRKEIYR
jgi:mRNA interferase RelE/StbE